MLTVITAFVVWLPVAAVLLYLIGVFISFHGKHQLKHLRQHVSFENGDHKAAVVGFFHPYCNAGGGGERVLWVAIRALQLRYAHVKCVVYTGDVDVTGDEILNKAKERFNIILPRTDKNSLEFVYLHQRKWVEAKRYPYFTMLGQSLGSIILGTEAMWKYVPDIFIDSMGYAFVLPLFKYLGSCSIGCYVHYPTISTDMLERVTQRTQAHNNPSVVSRNRFLSQFKIIYYRLFAYLYGVVGKRSDLVLVNSSWTEGHILQLWQAPHRTHVLYPPCDTQEFLKLSLDSKSKPRSIVSIAQFRPEKDHPLQIKAFSKFLKSHSNSEEQFKLVLVGSCRNDEDAERVASLKQLAEELEVIDSVEFRLNVPFKELKQCLTEATIGLHTMWNEHFGIGVVEMMAGGSIVLAHNSGGPKLDIVKDFDGHKTGFLASDLDSYAEAMETIFKMDEKDISDMQLNARASVDRFSDENFEIKFIEAMQNLLG